MTDQGHPPEDKNLLHSSEPPSETFPNTEDPGIPEGELPFENPTATAMERVQEKIRHFRGRIQTLDLESAIQSIQSFLQSAGKKGTLASAGKIATVLLSTWFAAGGTAIFLEKYIPEPPASSPRYGANRSSSGNNTLETFSAIWTRNLFNSKGLLPGEEGEEGPSDPGGAPIKSSLPLSLIGTLVLRDELRSIATIEDKSASLVYPLRAEDEIPGKIRIIGVEARRVVFLNLSSSRREFLELPPDNTTNARVALGAKTNLKSDGGKSAGVEQLSPTQFNVARSEIDAALSDLNKILTQARAVPNFENGQPNGYKLFQIVPGSIYDKLGLKNGDLLLGINGQGMSDPAKAFEMLSELKNQSHVDISVKRDGKASNFAYEIR